MIQSPFALLFQLPFPSSPLSRISQSQPTTTTTTTPSPSIPLPSSSCNTNVTAAAVNIHCKFPSHLFKHTLFFFLHVSSPWSSYQLPMYSYSTFTQHRSLQPTGAVPPGPSGGPPPPGPPGAPPSSSIAASSGRFMELLDFAKQEYDQVSSDCLSLKQQRDEYESRGA